jgi:hypothetical protein
MGWSQLYAPAAPGRHDVTISTRELHLRVTIVA